MRGLIWAVSLWISMASVYGATGPTLPKPDRYFTDQASVVSAQRGSEFNERLAQFERDTSCQLLVAIYRHLPANTSLEEFAANTFKSWGVGQAKLNNGAVLFVFIDDHKMRIEV